MMLDRLRGQSAIVTAAVVVVGLIACSVLLVLPRRGDVERVRAAQADATSEVAALEAELAELEALEASGALAEEVAAAARRIPASSDLPEFLAALDEAAMRSGVVLTSVAPGEPGSSTTSDIAEVPVSIGAAGPYFALARFVFELEHLSRLLRIDGVNIGAPVQGPGLELTVSAVAFTTQAVAEEVA